MKKVVIEVQLQDEREKRKVMRRVSELPGVDSIDMDIKAKKLTVVGDVDPVKLVGWLRKSRFSANLITVGPIKEEIAAKTKETKEKSDSGNQAKASNFQVADAVIPPRIYMTPYNYCYSVEEDPNSCVIS